MYAAQFAFGAPTLRDLILGLIHGNAGEMADRKRVAELSRAIAAVRESASDVRDLSASIRELEQRIAALPFADPALARERAIELRELLYASQRALEGVDGALRRHEDRAAPVMRVIAATVRAIAESRGGVAT